MLAEQNQTGAELAAEPRPRSRRAPTSGRHRAPVPPLQGPVGREAPSSPLGAVRAVAARPSMPSQPSRPGRVPAASLVRLSGGRGARPGRSSSYPQGCHHPASRFNAKRRLLKFLSSLSATAYCYQV